MTSHWTRSGALIAVGMVALFLASQLRADTISVPADMPVSQEELQLEINIKLQRVQQFLAQQGLAGVLITRVENVSWITGGLADNHIVITSEVGAASLLIMRDGSRYVVGEEGELARMSREDLRGLGYEVRSYKWHQDKTTPDRKLEIIHQLAHSQPIGTDVSYADLKQVADLLAPLRYQLTESEIKKYRWVGHAASEAVIAVCRKIQPGMSERQIEALASQELMQRGLRPTVLLMGVDHRVVDYYHHTPSDLRLQRYAIVNVCARRWGLVVSVARFVHFGALEPELIRKQKAAMNISALFEANSKPGVTAGQMMERAEKWYADAGFPGDWQEHHQGGAIGYAEREWLAVPGSSEMIHDHQAFAWNPIIHGTLSFDTILVEGDHLENLTRTTDWPTKPVEIDGVQYWMPEILIRSGEEGTR